MTNVKLLGFVSKISYIFVGVYICSLYIILRNDIKNDGFLFQTHIFLIIFFLVYGFIINKFYLKEVMKIE